MRTKTLIKDLFFLGVFVLFFIFYIPLFSSKVHADLYSLTCPGKYTDEREGWGYNDSGDLEFGPVCWAECIKPDESCYLTQDCLEPWSPLYTFDCGAGPGGEEECTGCSCTLPTCPVANDNDTRYTEDLPKDGDVVIEDPLPACVGKPNTCINKDSCGNACGNNPSKNCYLPETNLTAISDIPTPSWNNLKIGIRTFENLSTDSTKPSVVALPLPGVTISSITNVVANPTGSRELRYKFFIDATEPAVVQTYIKDDMENPEKLVDKPLIAKMVEGYEGSIATNYQTVNVCNDTVKEGGVLTTYYKVNGLPGHDGSISLEIGPLNANDDKDQGCKITDKYSGKKLHNPLKVVIKGTDENGTDTINGAYFWMVKKDIYSTFPPSYFDKRYPVGPGESRTNPNIIGLFVSRKVVDGNVYINLYKSTGNLSGFNRDSGGVYKEDNRRVQDLDNKELFTVIDIPTYNITSDGKFTFELHLEFPENSPLTGNYQLYAGMTDTLSYYPIGGETWVELRTNQLKTYEGWEWNFDFKNPVIKNFDIKRTGADQREITATWENDSTGSDIQKTVTNVYIPGGVETKPIKISEPISCKNDNFNVSTGAQTYLGYIDPIFSGWSFNNDTKTIFNIRDHSKGTVKTYLTTYDLACNFATVGGGGGGGGEVFDLNKWVVTKGGIFYSDGSVNYDTKYYADKSEPYTLGTELVTHTTDGNPVIRTFGGLDEIINPVMVKKITDTNDSTTGWNLLEEGFKKQKPGLTQINISSNTLTCPSDSRCIYNLDLDLVPGGDLELKNPYSGKIIVYSEGDITVNPDIVATNPSTDGLVIYSGGKITIDRGTHKSGDLEVKYDNIDALLIAKKQIQIDKDWVSADTEQQDGVDIKGSLIAFSNGVLVVIPPEPSIKLLRDLGLSNPFYPVLIVRYQPKYEKISELFFGLDKKVYKQEVGLKF